MGAVGIRTESQSANDFFAAFDHGIACPVGIVHDQCSVFLEMIAVHTISQQLRSEVRTDAGLEADSRFSGNPDGKSVVSQQIRKPRLFCGHIGIVTIFQSPDIHAYGRSVLIIPVHDRRLGISVRQFDDTAVVPYLRCIRDAVHVDGGSIIACRYLQYHIGGRGRHRAGACRHIFIDRDFENKGVLQCSRAFVQLFHAQCFTGRGCDILHILMGIYRVAGRSRHIEFLQVQGILSFFYVIRRDDIGTAQDRCIGIVPAIVPGVVQSIGDHLLVGAAAG